MFFQGRGNGQSAGILIERDANGIIGAARAFCPDSVNLALATDSFEHINKCGPVDVPDYRGIKKVSATLTFSFANADDLMFALATLGTVTPAQSPGTVSGEIGPDNLVNGDVYYLGGLSTHRGITSLVVTDSATSPATAVLNTDYTLDAATGKVTFVDVSGFNQPFVYAYGYTDVASVSILSAPQKSYFFQYNYINKANANDPGLMELYNVRIDPAATLDFMSDELQIFQLTGSALADTAKLSTDTEFGQFGRRVL